MAEQVVYYLNPEFAGTVECGWDAVEFPGLVKSHSEVEIFTLKEFQNMYNREYISDQGWIVIAPRLEQPVIDLKQVKMKF